MQPADVTPTCKPECGWGSWQKGGEGPVPGRRLREGSCEVFHPLPPALRTSCACWWRGEEGLPPGSPSHLPSGRPSLSSLPASACSDDARTGPSSRHDSPLTSVVIVGAVLPPSLPLAIPQRPSLPGSAALSGPQQVDGVGGRGGLKSPAPTSLQEKRHSLSIWGESNRAAPGVGGSGAQGTGHLPSPPVSSSPLPSPPPGSHSVHHPAQQLCRSSLRIQAFRHLL